MLETSGGSVGALSQQRYCWVGVRAGGGQGRWQRILPDIKERGEGGEAWMGRKALGENAEPAAARFSRA